MTYLRLIETESYSKVTPPSTFGPPQKLEWLSIASLRIDPFYQREITLVGRKNIRKIAEGFDWSMFSPVMVASVGSGLFAIVDGQHRTTAAALAGIERVPCAIVDSNRVAQAKSFSAINSNTTRLHAVQIFHASLAAGEGEALVLKGVCDRAGVSIVRYPTQTTSMKPGETMAAQTIARCIKRFGEDATVVGLRAIVSTCEGNAGQLVAPVVTGVVEVLADHKEWIADEKKLHAAFETISLEDLIQEARTMAARMKGTSIVDQFEGRLVEALDAHFKGKTAA